MIELLDAPEHLKSPLLRLEESSVAGIPYEGPAAEVAAKLTIQHAQSHIVKSSRWTAGNGSTYFDAAGNVLPLDEVVRSVISDGGILNVDGNLAYHIRGGRVVGFAIYGSHLKVFSYIKDHPHLLREFGIPDASVSVEAYGDHMGYRHRYAEAQKIIHWDSEGNKISLVCLGQVGDAAA